MPPDPTPPKTPLPPPVNLDAPCMACGHRMGDHTRNGYSTVFGRCTILTQREGSPLDVNGQCGCPRYRDPNTVLSSSPRGVQQEVNRIATEAGLHPGQTFSVTPELEDAMFPGVHNLVVTDVKVADDGQSAKMTFEGDHGKVLTHRIRFDRPPTTTGRDPDPVRAPAHYNMHPSGVEVIEITRHLNFCMGNVIKYTLRADHADDPIEDLMKARQYLEFEINTRLGKSPHAPFEDTVWQYQHPAPYDGDELDWLKEQPDAPHPETVSGEGEPLPKQEA